MLTGVIWALVALACWSFGDFYIQKACRVVGIWKALFYITFIGAVILFPFVGSEIPDVFSNNLKSLLLFLAGVVMLFAALFDFEALKDGKLDIVEPILGTELPLTVGLSFIFLGERISTV